MHICLQVYTDTMPTTATPLSPPANLCPLCSQPNQCALMQDARTTDCWCMHVRVAPVALAAVPGQERGLRCICANCATSPEKIERL